MNKGLFSFVVLIIVVALTYVVLAPAPAPVAEPGGTTELPAQEPEAAPEMPGDKSSQDSDKPEAEPLLRGASSCEALKKECDRLRLAYDTARSETRRLERELDDIIGDEPWLIDEATWREEQAGREDRQAAIERRQAADYRELAESAEEMAAKNRERDQRYPGKGWDDRAREDERRAEERRRKAEELERRAEKSEERARELRREAERLRARKVALKEALSQARSAEEQARIAWERCQEALEERCPEVPEEVRLTPPDEPLPIANIGPDSYICGPDVSGKVVDVIRQMIKDYRAATADEQAAACDALFDTDTAEYAWDIVELSPGILPDFDNPNSLGWFERSSPNCAIPRHYPCGPTVTFLGQCIHSQVVNYTQWGAMAELCERRTDAAIAHWLRATWSASWLDGEFKTAHYQGQKVMTGVGMQIAYTVEAAENDPDFAADPQRYTDEYKKQYVTEVAKLRLESEMKEHPGFSQRNEAQCHLPCTLNAQEQRLLDVRRWSYTWYGITDPLPAR